MRVGRRSPFGRMASLQLTSRRHRFCTGLNAAAGVALAFVLCMLGYTALAVRRPAVGPSGEPVTISARLSVFTMAAEGGEGAASAQSSSQRDINSLSGNSTRAATTGAGVLTLWDADGTGSHRSAAEAAAYDYALCKEQSLNGVHINLKHARIRHSTAPVPGLSDGVATGVYDDAYEAVDTDFQNYKFPFHVPENPGERTYADVDWCPGSNEPSADAVEPIDTAYRALFVIGAQKAGTSWMSQALSKHPSLLYGTSILMSKDGPKKELQFFNTWPARNTSAFLSMWNADDLEAMRNGTSRRFLFDGSPEYLLNAAVPPRIKQMVPQAKIVIILRDPTDRAFSSWNMIAEWDQFCEDLRARPATLCVEHTFQDTFHSWHNSFSRPECRFTTPGANVSWWDCFGCRYNLFRYNECCTQRHQLGEAVFPCYGVPRGFSVLDYSSYAAQIAWWLEFFPPEQMYIITSDGLKDPAKQVDILNDLLDFVGLPDVQRFDGSSLSPQMGFNGKYTTVSDEDVAAKDTVRLFHAPQRRDLRALLARYFPHVDTSEFATPRDDLADGPVYGPADSPEYFPVEAPLHGFAEGPVDAQAPLDAPQ